jgi:hypothetical protein
MGIFASTLCLIKQLLILLLIREHPETQSFSVSYMVYIYNMYIISCHSAVEHRASTRILHHTLFLASLLISTRSS